MAWQHLKAATESDIYDGQGSYKNIMYRICSLVRKDDQQHAGWCTASERYLAETSGFSERQVQRAVAQFKKDGVFTVRTYRKGGKEFNHYRPNQALFEARRRDRDQPVLVEESMPDDVESGDNEAARQGGGRPHDSLSNPTRPAGGVVGTTREIKGDEVNAMNSICSAELRSSRKGHRKAVTIALTGKDNGGSAPEPPLYRVQSGGEEPSSHFECKPGSGSQPLSPLESAASAARLKEEMLSALVAQRELLPPPPSKLAIAPPPKTRRPVPTTPYQVAKALVEETKRSAWDTFVRAFSLAFQFAGYLEDRKAKGEKAYAFDHWEVLYTADFIDSLSQGWRFKDLEDAIDAAQTTKHRFVCCTPRRLLDNGESLMKLVFALRRKGETLRQKLGERYPSWYMENAGSHAVEEMRRAVEEETAEAQRSAEEERRREAELDEDVPVLALATTGPIPCINPECRYRFDTREQMHRHFDDCFRNAYDHAPVDLEAVQAEMFADAFDDEDGVLPCAIDPWLEEDGAAGRWERYAADSGMMFNPWADEDATVRDGHDASDSEYRTAG